MKKKNNGKSEKPTGRAKERSTFTKWLIRGVILSFIIFIFCAAVYILKSLYISQTVASLASSHSLTRNEIKAFEALQTYYKDSSNFNIMSLLYVFISSVFIGVLGLFVNNQKERIDGIDKTRDELINKIENDIKNFAKNQEGRINELLNVLYSLSYAQMLANNIDLQCSINSTTIADISVYTTRFRDSMKDTFLIENLKKYDTPSPDEETKKRLVEQVNSIIELLESANEKKHPCYTDEIHNDLLSYPKICL